MDLDDYELIMVALDIFAIWKIKITETQKIYFIFPKKFGIKNLIFTQDIFASNLSIKVNTTY